MTVARRTFVAIDIDETQRIDLADIEVSLRRSRDQKKIHDDKKLEWQQLHQ
jgi:hypothetical protein